MNKLHSSPQGPYFCLPNVRKEPSLPRPHADPDWATQTCLEVLIVVEQGRPNQSKEFLKKRRFGDVDRVYTSRSDVCFPSISQIVRISKDDRRFSEISKNAFKYTNGYVLLHVMYIIYIIYI